MNESRLDVAGPGRPPMANGELVFAEPWEGRVFGITHALADAGVFTWDEFRRELIAAIGRWEAARHAPETYRYYECFSAALEAVLAARGVCDTQMLTARGAELAMRAPGHDHHEHHDHHPHHEHHHHRHDLD